MEKKTKSKEKKSKQARKIDEERRKDQLQIDFLRRSRGCDMTLPAMFRKTEQWIFYMDI